NTSLGLLDIRGGRMVSKWVVLLLAVCCAASVADAAGIRSWDNANQRGGDLSNAAGGELTYTQFRSALQARGHTILPGVATLTAANLAGVNVFLHGTGSHP